MPMWTSAHVHIWTCEYVHMWMYAQTYAHMNICTCEHMHIWAHSHMIMCSHMFICTHEYMYKWTYGLMNLWFFFTCTFFLHINVWTYEQSFWTCCFLCNQQRWGVGQVAACCYTKGARIRQVVTLKYANALSSKIHELMLLDFWKAWRRKLWSRCNNCMCLDCWSGFILRKCYSCTAVSRLSTCHMPHATCLRAR